MYYYYYYFVVVVNNLEQPFIENDETNAHPNSDIQEQ